MNEYYTIAAYNDHACGEAFFHESQETTDFNIAIFIAMQYANLYDHVCIVPYENRGKFFISDEYTKILPYVIDISVGDKVNVNKLLTLLKTP
jgi:hypothetical protein